MERETEKKEVERAGKEEIITVEPLAAGKACKTAGSRQSMQGYILTYLGLQRENL